MRIIFEYTEDDGVGMKVLDIDSNQKKTETLLIRADSNIIFGTGHVMRCLALAQVWRDIGGEVYFLMIPGSPSVEKRLVSEGMSILTLNEQPGTDNDANFTAEVAKKINARWIIIDGYQFGSAYQKQLKKYNYKILFVDDYGHADHYYADIILNQNIYANMSMYRHYEPYTRFRLGSDYVLLRKEFLKWAEYERTIPQIANKILVTFGGGESYDITLKVIEVLKRIDNCNIEVFIVVGGVSESSALVKSCVKNNKNFLIKNNITNMSELMIWADLAISAGGSTCWELAFTGLPNIIFILSADQELIGYNLSKQGISISLGKFNEIQTLSIYDAISELIYSPTKRNTMSKKGKKLVDGNGAARIISELKEAVYTKKI